MRMVKVATLSLLVLGTGCSVRANHWCDIVPTPISHQDDIFNDFVQRFYIDKNVSEALHTYATSDYIQHNPFVGQGAQATIDYLGPILPSVNLTLLHVGKDGDSGFAHYRLDGFGSQPTALVDVYRFNGSCIVEHWDVIEALPANATNPLALF